MRCLFVSLSLLLAAAASQAQDSTRVLPEIEVTAARGAATLAATGRSTRLDSAALRQTAASTLADLLARRGGVFVRAYGPTGLASASLRGTGAAQTLVLLDGFPLANPQLGQADLSLVPTALLARADILHGAASAWHGTGAVGGVVALASQAPGDGLQAHVEGEAGDYGTRGLTASMQAGTARRGLRLNVTHRRQTGDFPFERSPSETARRQNADAAQTGILATAHLGRSRAGLWLTDAERGLPGAAGTQAQHERQHDRTARLWLRHTRPTAHGVVQGGVALQMDALRYRNPLLGLDETGRARALTAEVSGVRALGTAWHVGGGVLYGFAQAVHPSLSDAAREHRAGLHVSADGETGRLHASLALRLDAYTRARSALTPRLGVGFDLTPHLRWMASGGSSFRVPTFNDRFWQPGGNAALKPERGWSAETGLRWQHGSLVAEVTTFAHAVREQIVWLPDATGVWRADNVGKVRTRGVEASVEWHGDGIGRPHGGAFYTLTDARDYTDPASASYRHPLRYVPHETARLYAGAAFGALAFDAGLRYTGIRHVQADGRGALDPYAVVDARTAYTARVPGGTMDATLIAENALDVRYSVLQGYPMPPRHLRFTLAYTWHKR